MNIKINSLREKILTEKLKVICIQGPSSSGKSSLLKKFEKIFENTFKINIDDYFQTQKRSNFINYDNPKFIRWIELFNLLDDIKNNKKYLEVYKYNFCDSKSIGPIRIKNPYPKTILIEGIYSFYLFAKIEIQKRFFNKIADFYCTINENTLSIYKISEHKSYLIQNDFIVVSILLLICKNVMINKKVERDVKERNISKRAVLAQIKFNTWPSTIKYIYKNIDEFDFIIDHGIFNTKFIDQVMKLFLDIIHNKEINYINIEKYVCEYCKNE